MTSRTSPTSSGSRAEVGSSKSSSLGRSASARAMPTRCCWPPESWYGCWSAFSPSPTLSSSARASLGLLGRTTLDHDRALGDVLQDGLVREQVVGLEDHRALRARPARAACLPAPARRSRPDVADPYGARVGGLEGVQGAQHRRLARTGRADEHGDGAGGHGKSMRAAPRPSPNDFFRPEPRAAAAHVLVLVDLLAHRATYLSSRSSRRPCANESTRQITQ